MPLKTHATHRIVITAPADQAFMFFTPAGEELWVDGWAPRYIDPPDGSTEEGMVFCTGEGPEFTVWTLLEFDRKTMRSRYLRCTPATRIGTVEVVCAAIDAHRSQVDITYKLTALNADGEAVLATFDGRPFVEMIDDWAAAITRNLPSLLSGSIR
jgi:hypothetical protein